MPEKDLAQSCPLCLHVDELPSMVPVEMPHALFETDRQRIICRQCAFAIADAVDGLERTPKIDQAELAPASLQNSESETEKPAQDGVETE